jgi:hypothetical protein
MAENDLSLKARAKLVILWIWRSVRRASFVDIAALIIALFALHSSERSAKEQERTLEASRHALETAVSTASSQLQIIQKQYEEELKRAQRKAALIFLIEGKKYTDPKSDGPLRLRRSKEGPVHFDGVIRNVGDAVAEHPIVLIVATPNTVTISERGEPTGRMPNVVQMSGITVHDIYPYDVALTDYAYNLDINAPAEVKSFDLSWKFIGANFPAHRFDVAVELVEEAPSPIPSQSPSP